MTMAMRIGMAVVLAAHGLGSGCGDADRLPRSVTAPSPPLTPPPTPPGAQPAPTGLAAGPVSGGVYDTADRPLPGAVVEALDGSRAGAAVVADAAGAFAFQGVFDGGTQFRASRDGHLASLAFVQPGRDPRGIDFHLTPTAVPVNLAGAYTMTITADPACPDLPVEARSRTYRATMVPIGGIPATYFDVSVTQARFPSGFSPAERFAILVAGDYISIWLGDRQTQPAFVEMLDASTYLAVGGGATATIAGTPPSIEVPFTGFVDYCAMPPAAESPAENEKYACPDATAVTHVRCQSSSHRLTLTPR